MNVFSSRSHSHYCSLSVCFHFTSRQTLAPAAKQIHSLTHFQHTLFGRRGQHQNNPNQTRFGLHACLCIVSFVRSPLCQLHTHTHTRQPKCVGAREIVEERDRERVAESENEKREMTVEYLREEKCDDTTKNM